MSTDLNRAEVTEYTNAIAEEVERWRKQHVSDYRLNVSLALASIFLAGLVAFTALVGLHWSGMESATLAGILGLVNTGVTALSQFQSLSAKAQHWRVHAARGHSIVDELRYGVTTGKEFELARHRFEKLRESATNVPGLKEAYSTQDTVGTETT